jgi:hypothetical protein
MKTMIRLTMAALVLAALAGAQDVTYNFDADANFANYRTFKWVEIPGGVKVDDLIAKQLTSALEAELTKKGLSKTAGDNADLLVGYQVAIRQERELSMYDTGWGRWGRAGMTTATTTTLKIGSVGLDMYDASKKQLVWRGIATKTIDEGAKPDKRQKNIQKGAVKLLKNYPPKKK